MKKQQWLALLLAAALLLSLSPAALAAAEEGAAEESAVVRRIETRAEFLRFARSCARESYSRGVRFLLTADIDLAGADFAGVPYFAGVFDGGGHRVSGLSLEGEGSRLGLFRRIGEGAEVRDLAVSGRVAPGGSREYIGGLCGVNEGSVKNCSFTGEVRGLNAVGGLIGLNRGSVSRCRAEAAVCGEHRVGGLAGENEGVLYDCESVGSVNAEEIVPESERSFDLSDLSDLSGLSREEFVDLSDFALVAGKNAGAVRACRAAGTVGWHRTGYNVGGVVGTNSGFVGECLFEGSVEGRRDVGGIVGQNVPYAVWELSEGKMKELEQAVRALHGMLNSASESLGGLNDALAPQLQNMISLSSQAVSAAQQLSGNLSSQTVHYLEGIEIDPETGEITLPSPDFSAPDTSAVTAALSGLYTQTQSITALLSDGVGDYAALWQQISSQISYIFNIVFSLMGELGDGDLISSRDLSLEEAYDHDEGAVADCENRGSVRAEVNAGGVVGHVAFELSFDREDTLSGADYLPTHAERLLYAVVRACRSSGAVECRGDCAGGVAGRLDVGAAVDCLNTGEVRSQSGLYVGGVAGRAEGSLARCTARCLLTGERYVGGAAGLGTDVTDCRVWAHIEGAAEYAGDLAGWCEGAVSGNLYVPDGPEGVDGVALIGQAEPITASEFFATASLPEGLESVTLRFLVEGACAEERTVPFGGAAGEPPQVDSRGGAAWVWDAFDGAAVYCDAEISGAYLAPVKTLSSQEEPPLFLAEGDFHDGQSLEVLPFDGAPERGERLGGYTLRVEDYSGTLRVRMRSEEGAAVYVPAGAGEWRALESEWDGHYLVFRLDNGGTFAVMAAARRQDGLVWIAAGGAALLLAALAGRAAARRRKAARAAAAAESEAPAGEAE